MNLKLFRTTAFRLSLIYALTFSLIAATAMGFIYLTAKKELMNQTDARLKLEANILIAQYRANDIDSLFKSLQQKQEDSRTSFFIYVLVHHDQKDITTGFIPEYTTLDGSQSFATLPMGMLLKGDAKHDNDPVRVLLTQLPDGYQLLVARDLNDQQKVLKKIFSAVILTILITLALALIVGMFFGQQVLRRIEKVRLAAGEIIDGDLSRRMPVNRRNNEFDQLSRTINSMLQRLEQLMHGMHNVTDNLAHDLRKPLNRMRNRLEVTLLENRDDETYRETIAETVEDTEELIKTFNALLSITRAESGERRQDWTEVDLTQLVEQMGELYEAAAEEADITFDATAEPGLQLCGNKQLLAQAITNLLDNAMKFTPAGGNVSLNARKRNGTIEVTVSDTGPGIPTNERERIFERFVRLDSARSTPGSGLGLSLVKAVAQLHQARITVTARHPGAAIALVFETDK
jgi:signal transduction histidine kinase